jgi:superfamily I DNA/RNA helicase
MIRLVEGIKELDETGRSSHFDLSDFVSYHDFLEYIDSEHGKDLAVIVNVISDIGYQGLITNLNMIKTISEDEADVILSTAHKSKGREWDKVKLANDFKQIESLAQARDENKDFAINPEEFNLLYVAITRAKRMLDVSALYYFTQLNKGSKENGLLPMSSQ